MGKEKRKVVYVKIEGGVFCAYKKPRGVTVDVIDHDVDHMAEEEPAACKCKQGGGTLHAHWRE